jgi:hypothetical protein
MAKTGLKNALRICAKDKTGRKKALHCDAKDKTGLRDTYVS